MRAFPVGIQMVHSSNNSTLCQIMIVLGCLTTEKADLFDEMIVKEHQNISKNIPKQFLVNQLHHHEDNYANFASGIDKIFPGEYMVLWLHDMLVSLGQIYPLRTYNCNQISGDSPMGTFKSTP